MDEKTRQEDRTSEEQGPKEPPPDLLERAVSWFSMVLVVGLAGFLLWEALEQPSAPVAITARAEAPWQAAGSYYLPLEVRNAGERSVQSLHLQIELVEAGQTVESTRLTLSWLPARSSRRAVALFRHDPQAYEVVATPMGYEQP